MRGRPPGWLQVAIVGLGTLVVPLDTTVNVAFPHIVGRFGIEVAAIKWVVICYVGVHASLMLVCGRLGDLIGHRRVFLAGCVWSAAAFVLCATAEAYGWLLAARALQGVGAALVLSVGAALVTAPYPASMRARVLGVYTMMFAIGAAIGPPLAGIMIARAGWASVYAFRVPLALLAFGLAWLLPRDGARRAASFDVAGGVLLVLATGLLLLGLDAIKAAGAWMLPCLVGAAAAFALFLRVEARSASPLIALRHFADPALGLALATATLLNLATFAILLLGPFLLAAASDLGPVASGLVLSASPVGMALAAPLAGRLVGAMGVGRMTVIGLAVTAGGMALLAVAAAPVNVGLAVVAMAVQGVGQGLFQVANFDQVTGALPPEDRGVAGSLALLTRTFGLMLGATLLMLAAQRFGGGGVQGGIGATFALSAVVAAALIPLQRLRRR